MPDVADRADMIKPGDLISFRPDGWENDEWSEPAIVVKRYENVEPAVWRVWVWPDREEFVINEDDHEIVLLTSYKQKEG